MRFTRRIGIGSVLSGILLSGMVQAATLTYEFGDWMAGYHLPDGPDTLASLTVETATNTFRLEANPDLALLGDSAFVGAVAFAGSLQPGLHHRHVEIVDVTASNPNGAVYFTPGGGPGGQIDFRNEIGRGASERLTAGGWIQWTVVASSLSTVSCCTCVGWARMANSRAGTA